mmetsp:Transcript_5209/g.19557  ORF Transcript_5209/g.19557 Transcript_5209/m.19557 type:complete len:276 (+) Transcript_5209:2646-3473(+)
MQLGAPGSSRSFATPKRQPWKTSSEVPTPAAGAASRRRAAGNSSMVYSQPSSAEMLNINRKAHDRCKAAAAPAHSRNVSGGASGGSVALELEACANSLQPCSRLRPSEAQGKPRSGVPPSSPSQPPSSPLHHVSADPASTVGSSLEAPATPPCREAPKANTRMPGAKHTPGVADASSREAPVAIHSGLHSGPMAAQARSMALATCSASNVLCCSTQGRCHGAALSRQQRVACNIGRSSRSGDVSMGNDGAPALFAAKSVAPKADAPACNAFAAAA